jgi:hypothetical protein
VWAFPRLIRVVLADPAQVVAERAGLHDMVATIHSPRCPERVPHCTSQMGRIFHVTFLPQVRTANRLRNTKTQKRTHAGLAAGGMSNRIGRELGWTNRKTALPVATHNSSQRQSRTLMTPNSDAPERSGQAAAVFMEGS